MKPDRADRLIAVPDNSRSTAMVDDFDASVPNDFV
jgi:hypothetical protein